MSGNGPDSRPDATVSRISIYASKAVAYSEGAASCMPAEISTAAVSAVATPHVDQYLSVGQQGGASDIHLGVNAQPIWRLYGNLQPIWPDVPKLTAEDTAALAAGFLNEAQQAQLDERGDVDFAYCERLRAFPDQRR